MASPPLLLRLLTTAVLLVYISTFAASIQDHELQRSLSVLRSRGYPLFSNAIATSDILNDVVSSHSASTFTFFAPTDASLYKLDMTGSASEYINTLRCHVITRRMTALQLRKVNSGSVFESLMKGRGVRVELWRNEFGGDDVITVNGVVVNFPGLYYSHNVAVHGLGGILNMSGGGELIPRPLAGSPTSAMNKLENHAAALPPPGISIPPDSAPPPEVTGNNNAFTSRPLIGGGGELLPPALAVARLRDPPTSPVNLLENHTAASPLAVSPASPMNKSENLTATLLPPGVLTPPDSAPPLEVTGKNNAFTSRPLIGGGGELLPPPLTVARLHDSPTSPVNLLENHTATLPPSGELIPPPLAVSPASPINKLENHTAAFPPPGVTTPPDSAPPREVTGNNNAFTSRPLIGGGGELLPPPLAVSRLRDPPTSPVDLLENHTAASPPSGSAPADAVPPAEVTENVDEFTSRGLISGGDSGGSTAVLAEDIAGVMEMLHSDLEKWDGRIFDCLLTDGFGHVTTPRGYLYTHQQSNTSMLSCAGLHQFLHFQHF